MESHKACPVAFSRERKLTFQNLLLFLMRLCKPSLQTELDRYFRSISTNPDDFDSVSKSAFSQARKKLKPSAFIELASHQLKYFESNAPYKKTWLGHRVVAIDGSTVQLPFSLELKEFFDKKNISSAYSTLMASISTAYDVNNQLIIDAKIDPYGTGEINQAEEHLTKLKEGDLVVMDRGYASLWWFGLLIKNKLDFCIRLSSSWKDARELMKKGECDIDWHPKNRKKELNPKFKEYQLPLELKNLRLVCIELENGEMEVLATTLTDREKYSMEKLKELYRLRWKVEENYKFLKHVLEVECFSGKSVTAIKQDFYARVFMANMASMITSQAMHEKLSNIPRSKHKYQLNRTQAMAKVRDCVISLLTSYNTSSILKTMQKLLSRCFEIIRPNRKAPRKPPSAVKKNLNYKGI